MNGMNAVVMGRYVEYVGDFLLAKLGFAPYFKTPNPVRGHGFVSVHLLTYEQFPFMETSAADGRANFFERDVTDYIGASV